MRSLSTFARLTGWAGGSVERPPLCKPLRHLNGGPRPAVQITGQGVGL